MKYRVRYSSRAKTHIVGIYRYISERASIAVADRFMSGVVEYCDAFETFPHRGTSRDDLQRGLRIVGYRRRISIAFVVESGSVTILGIYYGGADFEADFRNEAEN